MEKHIKLGDKRATDLRPVRQYPPMAYLEQVINHCPKAGRTYLTLWNIKGKQNSLKIAKKKIPDLALQSAHCFRENLRSLALEGLVSFAEKGDTLHIEIVDWEDLHDE